MQAVLLDPHPIWLDAVEIVLKRVGVGIVAKTTSGAEAITLVEELCPQLLTLEIDSCPGSRTASPFCVKRARRSRTCARSCSLEITRRATSTPHWQRRLGVHRQDRSPGRRRLGCPAGVRPLGLPAGDGREHPRGGAPATAREIPGGLTRRELEILKLVAEGHSNAALARMLWVTEQTVKFHLSNVYRKLEVTNRTEASRWAQVNGLLGDELTIA